jgi:hypothetical protein
VYQKILVCKIDGGKIFLNSIRVSLSRALTIYSPCYIKITIYLYYYKPNDHLDPCNNPISSMVQIPMVLHIHNCLMAH